MRKEELMEKVRKREAKIAVIGLGYVGLPTASVFANSGFTVTGADVNPKIVEIVSEGKSHMKEPSVNKLVEKAVKGNKLKATTGILQATKEADVIFVCVQTPLTERKKPNLTYLEKACETVAKGLSKGKLVAIESTVPPKTTRELVAPILERGSGLRCGEDFWLVHCPERILPGKTVREFVENPRIVGGYDKDGAEIAVELFKTVTRGDILVTDSTSAEAAKLAENTFRDVNIAFANELALICERVGIDVMEVMRLANTHPRVDIHRPGCGVGGTCLPKDPYLLLYPVEKESFKSRVIRPCRELNDYMSRRTVEMVVEALRTAGKDVGSSKVAVLGAAYKGGVSETRNSPAEGIVQGLVSLGADIVVYDPYCEESFGAERARDVNEAVRGADCIVIATDHKVFRELELGRIRALMKEDPALVDGRRVVHPVEAKKQGFMYFGIGVGVG